MGIFADEDEQVPKKAEPLPPGVLRDAAPPAQKRGLVHREPCPWCGDAGAHVLILTVSCPNRSCALYDARVFP